MRLPEDFTTPPAFRQQLSFPALQGLWQRAGSSYGIPWQVLASINRIESNFGQNMGPSSAGAVGWMQFMPSTWLRWGMDADGDGLADPWNPEDAVYSAARYLAAAGGATDIPRAIFAYNHAQWYVDEVLAGARVYDSGGVRSRSRPARPASRSTTAEAAVGNAESLHRPGATHRAEVRPARGRPSPPGRGRRALLAPPRAGARSRTSRIPPGRRSRRDRAARRRADRRAGCSRGGTPERAHRVSLPERGRTDSVLRGRLRLPRRR